MEPKRFYEFGPFRVDLNSRVLLREGGVIDLSPRVFDLLSVLISEAGNVVTKEMLLERVWQETFVEEGNIAFNVNRLRKALGDNAESPLYIETIRGRGYRFITEVRLTNLDYGASFPPPQHSLNGTRTIALETRSAHDFDGTSDSLQSPGAINLEAPTDNDPLEPLGALNNHSPLTVQTTPRRKVLVALIGVALTFAVAESVRRLTAERNGTSRPSTLQEITLEVETGAGDGKIMPRSNASNLQSALLQQGESRTLTFQIDTAGTYDLQVRYSNDNKGPLETISILIDGELLASFITFDTGDDGNGWNNFLLSGASPLVKLSEGQHTLMLTVSPGDGYGVEPDAVILHRLSL